MKNARPCPKGVAEVTGSLYDAMVYQYNQMDLPYGLTEARSG